jgi:hypothetical protein
MKPSQVNPPEADKPEGSHKRKAKIPIFHLNSYRAVPIKLYLCYVSTPNGSESPFCSDPGWRDFCFAPRSSRGLKFKVMLWHSIKQTF